MRVAIITDPIDNQSAGVHVYTREMVNSLIRNNPGHEIIIIREKRNQKLSGVKQISVWNSRLPIGFASLRLFFLIPLILKRNNVDIVIEPAHFGPFNLDSEVRRVTIIHDLTPILFPHLHRWHSQILQKIFLKSILNKADLIIANSDNTKKDICKVYPGNCHKVTRIYPGVDANYNLNSNHAVLKKYKIHQRYFLFVGTVEPRKNLELLLKAFKIFKEKNSSDIVLVISGGKGWKSKSFFDAVESHPFKSDIIITGFVQQDDLPALYSNAIALIYPSSYEGFGFPIVEAMRCGCPVITANNSSLIESGGDAVLYFNDNDIETLESYMTHVMNDAEFRTQLSQKSIAHASKFDWNNFGKQMWKSLEDIISS